MSKSAVADRPAQTTPRPSTSAPAAASVRWTRASAALSDFVQIYLADPMELVRIVKSGVPAGSIEVLARRLGVSKERLVATLGLGRATIDRKVRGNKPLSTDESSMVLGMARLIGQVQLMVEESGNPEGFDAAAWLGQWLERPQPALGGCRAAEWMDTLEGQKIVSNLVGRIQSGAYS